MNTSVFLRFMCRSKGADPIRAISTGDFIAGRWDQSGVSPFRVRSITCWNVGSYLRFAGVSIVRFVDLPDSFSGLVGLRLSGAQVWVVVADLFGQYLGLAAFQFISQGLLMRPYQSSVPDVQPNVMFIKPSSANDRLMLS